MNGSGLMPKIDIKGLEGLNVSLDELYAKSPEIIKRGIYDGSHVLYELAKSGIENLHNIDPAYKEGLLTSLYHAKMTDKSGAITEVISFTGYNSKGQPNIEVARSIMNGSSRNKHKVPIMRQAVNRGKAQAINVTQETISKEVKKNTKG